MTAHYNRGCLTTKYSMADLIGFDGFLNESTPFVPEEHEVMWKSDRQYPDFAFGNTKTSTCKLPRFWDDSGRAVMTGAGDANISSGVFDKLSSQTECYNSDFDQVSWPQVVLILYI